MPAKKTLEEYQIQEIATAVVSAELAKTMPNLVQRGEFDKYTISNDSAITALNKTVGGLELKDSERDKDKRAMRLQMIGLGMGVALNVIIWVIAASSGFKVGG